ncbi:MAG TPA: serine hydrolase [Gemmata sp.]|jgi:CubicO group peptidase (beta-lactamase class C family)|nr:serine hydrolase [Gemmata sp.]
MRRLALFFIFLFIPQAGRAAEFDAKPIDAVVEKAMKEFQVPGAAVVVVKDDEVIYLKGFGVREKGKPAEVTPNTVFPIASCSKAFTSTAIAMLVDEGKLAWDDKVRTHLDYFRLSDELADRDVTVRDLLCHRTGMPRHDMIWAGQNLDSGELIRRWGKGVPSTSFRSTWEYSNIPFTTAGVIAGRLEKSNWATAIERRILTPLEMSSTSCTVAAGQAAPDHATPHYLGLDKSITAVKWDVIDHAGGAGCVNSTATDLGNWLRFQLAGGKFGSKRLVSTRVLHETHFPQMLLKAEGVWALYFPPKSTRFTTYGLGWFVHDYRGFNCVSHGGTLTGIRAQCMMVPDKKIGVFVVCNLRPSLFPEAVAKSVLDQLLGLPAEDWVTLSKDQLALFDFNAAVRLKKREKDRKPDTKPSLPLKGYAGTYDESAYGRAVVSVEDDKLMIRWGHYTFRLEHYHFDTFTAILVEPADEAITFDRTSFDVLFRLGTSGEVEGMKFLDQEFRKTKGK